MRAHSTLALLTIAVAALSGCSGFDVVAGAQRVEGRFERHLATNGVVDLSARTGSGSIDIRTAEGAGVRVIGRVSARDTSAGDAAEKVRRIENDPPIVQQGNMVQIGDVRDNPLYRNVSISYEITVPADTQLTVQTGSGSQKIGAVNGPIRAQTGSGSIAVDSTGGSLSAQTGSGSIRVGGVNGAIRAQTGSGSVRVTQTGPGDVTVQTGSGSVVLSLPPTAGFTLDARTGSGGIKTSHPLTVQGRIGRNAVQGSVRGGGQHVRVTTGSGSIDIR